MPQYPNTVLLCDSEFFTGTGGASGLSTTVLLVAIPTRNWTLTNATTCPCANVPMPWQTISITTPTTIVLLLLSLETKMTNPADNTGVE